MADEKKTILIEAKLHQKLKLLSFKKGVSLYEMVTDHLEQLVKRKAK